MWKQRGDGLSKEQILAALGGLYHRELLDMKGGECRACDAPHGCAIWRVKTIADEPETSAPETSGPTAPYYAST